MKNSSITIQERLTRRDSTEYIVVHQSATKADHDATIEDIHRWHLSRGWSGCGYNFVIERDGALRVGRPLWAQGAHVYGHNHHSVGICMVGGISETDEVVDNYSDSQYKTLEALLIVLKEFYPDAQICKHKDLAETLCNEVNLKRAVK